MFRSVSALPPLDPANIKLADPGKRQWETSESGYINWAVGQLLDKGASAAGGGTSRPAINALTSKVEDVGETSILRAAIEAASVVTQDSRTAD